MSRVVERCMWCLLLSLVMAGAWASSSSAAVRRFQFIAESVVPVHAERSLESDLLFELLPGQILDVQEPFVYNDAVIWVDVAGIGGGYVAAARYAACDIFSFGEYVPPEMAPVSVGPYARD